MQPLSASNGANNGKKVLKLMDVATIVDGNVLISGLIWSCSGNPQEKMELASTKMKNAKRVASEEIIMGDDETWQNVWRHGSAVRRHLERHIS
ncbi:unnamed protein product [Caenorhabditis auriculariae]|uniref:Uncharacterized protein n=1 Tax=Caenorhabditis auriculariae TaxID=2777116 RepID=A0A8S1GWV2_9PELO|nr:unnamed protein product [Caenorhabditis auriculariae]